MRDNLPAVPSSSLPDQIRSGRDSGRLSGLSTWLGSPIGRAVAQALPDVLRMANRNRLPEQRPLVSQILPSSDGASGMTLSEVEVDIDVPFIRRVTIRSASSWSVAPDVLKTQYRQDRRNRWKLRALAAGAIGVASVMLARKSGMTLPAKLSPSALMPLLPATSSSSSSSTTNTSTKTPGAAR
jgi:hypothetical protein